MIILNGPLTPEFTEQFILYLKESPQPFLYIQSSPGGSTYLANKIIHEISRVQNEEHKKVSVHTEHYMGSSALDIFIVCENRSMSSNAQGRFHTSVVKEGDIKFYVNYDGQMACVYEMQTGIDAQIIIRLFHKKAKFGAYTAKRKGIVHQIQTVTTL